MGGSLGWKNGTAHMNFSNRGKTTDVVSQTLTGVVDVREFAGDLADYIGETADYVATLTPVHKWNMVVGGSWKFNNHYNVALEAGIIGRKKISLGFLYNF